MGEVYAAEDTKLNRKVALKVLPEIFAIDPDRRRRFEREAQAVAALNHPNIVTIYSVEEADGVPFLTMELVDGKPLNELIPAGGMPLPLLLRVGTAIADAMSAAQQRGITHRDLKPANVMVTSDGRVKVLDFGLARLQEAEAAAAGDALTRLGSENVTGEGKIVGTVAYMSPEQAEGKPVDPRSDIFSLGVLLHEMATGERPFKGDTSVSIISSILKDTPSSITDLNPKLPADLARIVRRCLSKDPSRRFQTATDVRAELEDLTTELTSGSGVTAKPQVRRRGRTPWIAAAIAGAVVLAGAAGVWLFRGRSGVPSGAEQGFTIDRFTRLTTSGRASIAALSRDGRYVVHVKRGQGEPSLWVRQTATSSDVQIVPPAPVTYDELAFSPDGNYVYYNTYLKPGGGLANLYRIPVLGGAPVPVLEDVDCAPAFSPDGSEFAFMRGLVEKGTTALMLAGADGSNVRTLATVPSPDRFHSETPSWSPDGKTLLAAVSRQKGMATVFEVDVSTGRAQPVGQDWAFVRSPQWMPDGRSFLINAIDTREATPNPQIWRVSYPSGARTRVTNDLNVYLGIGLSADGRTLETVQGAVSAGLSLFERGGHGWQTVTPPSSRGDGIGGVAVLPDGRILYATGGGSGVPQISVLNADGSSQRPLTSGPLPSLNPYPSEDGRWVYFQSYTVNGMCIFRIAPDGSGLQQLTRGGDEARPIPSPDGRTIFMTRSRPGQPHLARVSAEGGEPTLVSDAYFSALDISHDGTRLVGTTWDAERRRPATGILKSDGTGPVGMVDDVPPPARWLPDGSLMYPERRQSPMAIFVKPVAGGPAHQAAPPTGDTAFNGTASRDGKVFVISHGSQTTDVVLISAAGQAKRP